MKDTPPPAEAPSPAPGRRHLLIGATALAAAGAGLYSFLRAQGPALGAAESRFWTLELPQPDGATLRTAAFRGKPLLLNFWATWCPPCIKELPEIDRFHTAMRPQGWGVIGLAVDAPTPVRNFLARQPLGFPVALAGLEGTEMSRELGNTQGALPFTVLFDAGGRIVQRKLGETHRAELQAWAAALHR